MTTFPKKAAFVLISPPTRGFNLGLEELWGYRELLYFLIWRDIKVKYKQTLIGAAWAVIQPLVAMVVFTIIFGELADLPTGGLPAPIFYFSALVVWLYFANALNLATNSLVTNQGLITKVYFPRILLPLAATLAGLIDFGITFAILLAMAVFYGIEPSITLLFLPIFFAGAVTTVLGSGLWLSALNALFRDIRHGIPFLIQIWFFASPVIYPASRVPQNWRWAYAMNPMAEIIEGFRWSLTGQGRTPGLEVLISAAVILLLVGTGLYFFRRTETLVVDVV